jgi:hypothetical protein
MSPRLSRRDFLAAVLAAAVAGPLIARAGTAGVPPLRTRLFKDRVLDKGPIADYARLYLARHPEESRPEVLQRKLFGGGADKDADTLKRGLLRDIRGDFAEGRTVNLDGWVLAVTEVRLWCLYLAATP